MVVLSPTRNRHGTRLRRERAERPGTSGKTREARQRSEPREVQDANRKEGAVLRKERAAGKERASSPRARSVSSAPSCAVFQRQSGDVYLVCQRFPRPIHEQCLFSQLEQNTDTFRSSPRPAGRCEDTPRRVTPTAARKKSRMTTPLWNVVGDSDGEAVRVASPALRLGTLGLLPGCALERLRDSS
ncbi:hypothetical protein FKP32DRAFT_1589310 [Trametes sanguinea]|nr:hypothetical protein FKP32DRAFT_1589310 [Trametes sanguinea]